MKALALLWNYFRTPGKPVYLLMSKDGEVKTWSVSGRDMRKERLAQWEPDEWIVLRVTLAT